MFDTFTLPFRLAWAEKCEIERLESFDLGGTLEHLVEDPATAGRRIDVRSFQFLESFLHRWAGVAISPHIDDIVKQGLAQEQGVDDELFLLFSMLKFGIVESGCYILCVGSKVTVLGGLANEGRDDRSTDPHHQFNQMHELGLVARNYPLSASMYMRHRSLHT